MKCVRCDLFFGDNWEPHLMLRNEQATTWAYRTAECPSCREVIVQVGRTDREGELRGDWRQIDPLGSSNDTVRAAQFPANVREKI
jgi:hypothetical protein